MLRNGSKQPDLYYFFSMGVFHYLLDHDGPGLEPWHLVPKDHHIGRQNTMAAIRKMIAKLMRQFPGALFWAHKRLVMSPLFKDFLRTHQRMRSTVAEAMAAWAAMKDIGE